MYRSFYLTFFFIFFLLTTLFNQENYNLSVRSNLPFPGLSLANIWGYADSLGNEYALVGTSAGLSIVDVTNPDKPMLKFTVSGVKSGWREIKTWGSFAYVTSEGSNSGLTIIDLRKLPDTIFSKVYKGDGTIADLLSTNHALHIDNGFCYLYGTNSSGNPTISNGGAVILDLKDPWNPKYSGKYSQEYIHDGYVANDTLWACNILNGRFSVISVKNKSNPILLAQQTTPTGLTHNSWLTDNHSTLLVTEETSNSFLTAWDIRNISNISELDRYQTAPGSNSTVHNTHVINDFAVTSWYTEGVVIVDASRPQNLVEVAKNDFTPLEGEGTNGCWGVYPYLPSGNIVASDMQKGLYVLTPNYIRAGFLEGTVRDSICGNLIENVEVSVIGTDRLDNTGLQGIFRTGVAKTGLYDISFSKSGYPTKTIKQVLLESGKVKELHVKLYNPQNISISGIINQNDNMPIENVQITLSNSKTSYNLISNSDGLFSKCDIVPGKYDFIAGKWGYQARCEKQIDITTSQSVSRKLEKGYYDDFQFNFGWKRTGSASSGLWTTGIPVGTFYSGMSSNPSSDVNGDCNSRALITGNAASSNPGADDVDDGATIITSPPFDLTGFQDPYIYVYRWFFNGGGSNPSSNDANDTLFLRIRQNGKVITLKKISKTSGMSTWLKESFRIKDYIPQPGVVEFIAEATDFFPGHLVEAGLDLFQVRDSNITVGMNQEEIKSFLNIYPNPSSGQTSISYYLENDFTGANLDVFDISGRSVLSFPLDTKQGFIPINSLPEAGLYIITISQKGGQLLKSLWVRN